MSSSFTRLVLLSALALALGCSGGGKPCVDDLGCPEGQICDQGLSEPGNRPIDAGADAGQADAGRPDAGAQDAGAPDSGFDGGAQDSGTPDAGAPDSGIPFDAGAPDASIDSGIATDAGSTLDGGIDAGDWTYLEDGGLWDGGLRFFGPTPYRSASDSPFALIYFSTYRYLETFESHLAQPRGVATNVQTTASSFPQSSIDSVDGDDGVVNDACPGCDSAYVSNGAVGARFTFLKTFADGGLGILPSHVGIVFTDGLPNNTVTLEVYGPDAGLLGSLVGTGIGDGTYDSSYGEDRFFGAYFPEGFSEIRLLAPGANLDTDHLFYAR